jgi:hypothetical protein
VKAAIKVIIIFYHKYLACYLPAQCRYYPSCSQYFLQAVEKKGFFKGTLLGIKRILKCNPLFPGGYDPVR